MIWVPFALLLVAVAFDLWKREVPDTISIVMLLWAVVVLSLRLRPLTWLEVLLGLTVGFAGGAVLFWLGGLGGGDVKLMAALGANLGPMPLLAMLLYVAIAGGVISAIAGMRGKKEIAYVPAIALGFLVFILAGERAPWAVI